MTKEERDRLRQVVLDKLRSETAKNRRVGLSDLHVAKWFLWKQVERELGLIVTEGQLARTLKQLRDEGLATSDRRGGWRVTEEGCVVSKSKWTPEMEEYANYLLAHPVLGVTMDVFKAAVAELRRLQGLLVAIPDDKVEGLADELARQPPAGRLNVGGFEHRKDLARCAIMAGIELGQLSRVSEGQCLHEVDGCERGRTAGYAEGKAEAYAEGLMAGRKEEVNHLLHAKPCSVPVIKQAVDDAKAEGALEENEACADHLRRVGNQYAIGDGVEQCDYTADAYLAAARSISARRKP